MRSAYFRIALRGDRGESETTHPGDLCFLYTAKAPERSARPSGVFLLTNPVRDYHLNCMATKGHRALVLGYLERLGSSAFEHYQAQIAELISDRHGIYALYKDERLYYIGLATNLRARVQHHLRDKHRDRWNRFSLYLVRRHEHLRELESLLLRISDPKGNRQRGKLKEARNLRRVIARTARDADKRRRNELFGENITLGKKRTLIRREVSSLANGRKQPPLANLVAQSMPIRATYKGKLFKARVRRDGHISFDGEIFKTPSGAAAKVRGHGGVDGWYFWKFRGRDGDWKILHALRQ